MSDSEGKAALFAAQMMLLPVVAGVALALSPAMLVIVPAYHIVRACTTSDRQVAQNDLQQAQAQVNQLQPEQQAQLQPAIDAAREVANNPSSSQRDGQVEIIKKALDPLFDQLNSEIEKKTDELNKLFKNKTNNPKVGQYVEMKKTILKDMSTVSDELKKLTLSISSNGTTNEQRSELVSIGEKLTKITKEGEALKEIQEQLPQNIKQQELISNQQQLISKHKINKDLYKQIINDMISKYTERFKIIEDEINKLIQTNAASKSISLINPNSGQKLQTAKSKLTKIQEEIKTEIESTIQKNSTLNNKVKNSIIELSKELTKNINDNISTLITKIDTIKKYPNQKPIVKPPNKPPNKPVIRGLSNNEKFSEQVSNTFGVRSLLSSPTKPPNKTIKRGLSNNEKFSEQVSNTFSPLSILLSSVKNIFKRTVKSTNNERNKERNEKRNENLKIISNPSATEKSRAQAIGELRQLLNSDNRLSMNAKKEILDKYNEIYKTTNGMANEQKQISQTKSSLKKLHDDIIKNITNYTKTVNTIKKELNDITIANSASNTITLKQGKDEILLDKESALLQLQITLEKLKDKITTKINQNTTLKLNNKTHTKMLSINPLKQLSENVNKLINTVQQLKKKPNQNSVANPENIQVNLNGNRSQNNTLNRSFVPLLQRQNAMKRTNAGPASAPVRSIVQNENVGPLAASAAYALGLGNPQPVRQNSSVSVPSKGLNSRAIPPPPTNGKITITWKGKQETINIKEMNNCDQVTQYLKNNPTTAVIYRMSSAEIEKAKRVEGEGVWFAVICYIDNNGKQINQPITMNDISNTDLYDIIRNKKVVFFTDSLTMQGGKRAKKRPTKKNKRSTHRNRTYRK